MTEAADIMEWYRSGHNEHDWKSCDGQKPSEGSNPSHSAKTKKLQEHMFLQFFYVSTAQNVRFIQFFRNNGIILAKSRIAKHSIT